MEYVAFDCRKRYTFAVVEDERGMVRQGGEDPPRAWGPQEVPLAV
jgi:hypothetical protein